MVVHFKTFNTQSEHIGQWATPHDRRLGGIGRVVPIALIQSVVVYFILLLPTNHTEV